MKPLYLEIEGFGPYLEKTVLDFTSLKSNLTLITGNTGAGKTTIFDAICCALFGETSGKSRSFSQMRSELATSSDITKIKFEFELKGEKYEITRSPNYKRENRRDKTKLVEVPAKAELILPDGQSIHKAQNVTEKIKEILGIGKEEFRQIVMIAQNDFMAMIKETDKKQEDTFNRIFDAELFRKFSLEILHKKGNLLKEVEKLRISILNILDSQNIAYDQIEINASNINTEVLEKSLISELEETEKKKKGLEKDLTKIQKEINKKRIEVNEATSIIDEIEKRKILLVRLEELKDKEEQINKLKSERKRAERARDNIQETYKQIEELTSRKNQQTEELKDLELKIITTKENIKNLEKELNSYSDKDIESLKKYIDRLTEIIQVQEILEKISRELDGYRTKYKELDLKIENNKKLIQELERKTNLLDIFPEETFITKEKSLNLEIDSYSRDLGQIEEIGKLCSRQLELIEKFKKAYKSLINLKKDYISAKTNYDNAFDSYINNQAALIAEELKIDEACPVCGSLSHPNPATYDGKKISENELDELKTLANEIESKYREKAEEIGLLENTLKENKNNIVKNFKQFSPNILEEGDYSKENLNNLEYLDISLENIKEIEQAIDSLRGDLRISFINTKKHIEEINQKLKENSDNKKKNQMAQKEKNELNGKIDSLNKSIIHLEEERQNQKEKIIQLETQEKAESKKNNLIEVSDPKEELKKETKRLRDYKNQKEELQSSLNSSNESLNQTKGEINSRRNSLKNLKERIDKLNLSFGQLLKQEMFKDREDFLNSLRTPKELDNINTTISSYDSEYIKVQENLRIINKNLENSATRF